MSDKKNLEAFISLIEERPDDALAAAQALTIFNRRQARIDHPEGGTDNGGRWYPEGRDDIGMAVRSPSRSYPWSYMLHCRSLDHCECLTGADHDDVLTIRRGLLAQGQERNGFTEREETITGEFMKSMAADAKRALSQFESIKRKKALSM